ncbi:MAG: methyltransferase, partial [[Mycobacterium] stephanolepidis]
MGNAESRWVEVDEYLERTVTADAAELDHIRQAQE